MLLKAEIKIRYENERIAEHILRSIEPENFISEELKIRSIIRNNELYTEIITTKSVGTLKNTIDDLLMAIQLAEKILKKED